MHRASLASPLSASPAVVSRCRMRPYTQYLPPTTLYKPWRFLSRGETLPLLGVTDIYIDLMEILCLVTVVGRPACWALPARLPPRHANPRTLKSNSHAREEPSKSCVMFRIGTHAARHPQDVAPCSSSLLLLLLYSSFLPSLRSSPSSSSFSLLSKLVISCYSLLTVDEVSLFPWFLL